MADNQTARRAHPQDQPRHHDADQPARLTAEEARQARIVLNTPGRRAIFVAGLAGIAALFIIGAIIS